MEPAVHQLPPDVAAKYTCSIQPCRVVLPFLGRTVDLRELTLAEADELAAHPRFPYLQLRQNPKRAAKRSPRS